MSTIDPQPGEIWQESDGCAILYLGGDRWLGFGSEIFTLEDAPGGIELPLCRLLTAGGDIAPERFPE